MQAQTAGWHKEDIKAAVYKTGTTLRDLSVEAGFAPSIVSQSLCSPIPAANKAIANRIGHSVHELWPQWFDADGNVIPRRRRSGRRPKVARR